MTNPILNNAPIAVVPISPAIALKVMAGDYYDLGVKSYYKPKPVTGKNSPGYTTTRIISALVGSMSTSVAAVSLGKATGGQNLPSCC